MQKITIIGAGLSGLYTALLLQDTYDITILEARERIGGRIYTIDGFDMGPSWIWSHQKEILDLISTMGLTLFSQYTKGEALYHTTQGVQRFAPPPSAPSARVEGGLIKLINAIATQLKPDTLYLNQTVTAIQEEDNILHITTQETRFQSDYVLVTLPPRLAAKNISYTPKLAPSALQKLQQTQTWMGHTAKCVIVFEDAFWREEGLSGFVFSHSGPLSEIHDACTSTQSALFGFTSTTLPKEQLIEKVREQMQTLFGSKGKAIKAIHFIDWREEVFSAVSEDARAMGSHPNYGFNISHFNNRLHFMGTESANNEGGYLEGAVISAKKIAKLLSSK